MEREQADLEGKVSIPLVVGSVLAAVLATVLFVLPVEYGVDPTGFGRATGLLQLKAPAEIKVETRLSAPPEVAKVHSLPFRSDVIEIEVPPFSQNYGQIEYKVTMQAGDALTFSWKSDLPVIYEMHGHTMAGHEGDDIVVMDYVAGQGAEMHGQLVAPIDGIHGWYFANSVLDDPTKIEIRLSGYYELAPGLMVLSR